MRFVAMVGGLNRKGGHSGHEIEVRVEGLPATPSVALALRMLASQLEQLAANVDERIARMDAD